MTMRCSPVNSRSSWMEIGARLLDSHAAEPPRPVKALRESRILVSVTFVFSDFDTRITAPSGVNPVLVGLRSNIHKFLPSVAFHKRDSTTTANAINESAAIIALLQIQAALARAVHNELLMEDLV